jgi:signal transduction histidine kinase
MSTRDAPPDSRRPHWHVWAPALFAVLVQMFLLSYRETGHWVAPTGTQTILVLSACAALLLRYRAPTAVACVTVLLGSAVPVVPPHVVTVDVPAIVALYTAAVVVRRRTVWTVAVAAVVLLTTSSVLWLPGHLLDVRNVLPLNYVAVAVAVGDAVRNRRELLRQADERAREAERTRAEEARRQVREERVRIARDLHDVVAHHITLVNAQAGVAHHLMDTHPDQARRTLAEITRTSRAALDELRATVGLLRQDDDPQSRHPVPGLDRLPELTESLRAAGFETAVTRRGEACPLTGVADTAAYRIVQEALTNANKHGLERRAEVTLDYRPDVLAITVTNTARPGHRGPGTGHGLLGMRERAQTAGGTCTTRMTPDGEFEVRADLPLSPAGPR